MAWESLGTVTVGQDWASFPIEVIGSDSIRLIHTTPLSQNYCVGHLSQYFALPSPGGRLSPWRRIYSGADPVIVALPIPQALRDASILTYTLQVKARSYYFLVPWQIEAQAYYP